LIIFHEGLPGSGKSYEAVEFRIVPALKAGRIVQARVNGLNFAKLAELAEITEEQCRALLEAIPDDKDHVRKISQWAKQNALIILDEAAGTWGNRYKLEEETADWVKEHRHHGNDVVLMDQDARDLHAIWRRRIDIKSCFVKLSALGTSKRYSVTTFRHKGGDQYEKVGTVVRKYNPAFFGSYASHAADDVKTDDYQDKRATVWGNALFSMGIPAALLAGCLGAWYAWGYFHPKPATQAAQNAPQGAKAGGAAPGVQGAAATPASAPKGPDNRSPMEKRLAGYSDKYRIRLAGLVSRGDRVSGYIEWVDSGSRVMERLSLDQLRQMGSAVVVGEGFVTVSVGAWSDMATMWPLEADGRVSENRLAAMRPQDVPVPAGVMSLGGPTVIAPKGKAEDPDAKGAPVVVVRPRT